MLREEVFNGFMDKGSMLFDREQEPNPVRAPIWRYMASAVVEYYEILNADDSIADVRDKGPLYGSLEESVKHRVVYCEIMELYYDSLAINEKLLLCTATEGLEVGRE